MFVPMLVLTFALAAAQPSPRRIHALTHASAHATIHPILTIPTIPNEAVVCDGLNQLLNHPISVHACIKYKVWLRISRP